MSAKSDIDTIAHFRFMAELLLGTTDPLVTKDFVGVRKDRIYFITGRLKAEELITETRVRGQGGVDGYISQWCLADDATAETRLREIVDDDEKASELLWPPASARVDQELEGAENETVEETAEAPADPFTLLHDILEGWNVRMGQIDQMRADIADIVVSSIKRDEAATAREESLVALVQLQIEALEANAKAFAAPPVVTLPEHTSADALAKLADRVNGLTAMVMDLRTHIDEKEIETAQARSALTAEIVEQRKDLHTALLQVNGMPKAVSVLRDGVAYQSTAFTNWAKALEEWTEETRSLQKILQRVHKDNIEISRRAEAEHECNDEAHDGIMRAIIAVSQGKALSEERLAKPESTKKASGQPKLPGLAAMMQKKDDDRLEIKAVRGLRKLSDAGFSSTALSSLANLTDEDVRGIVSVSHLAQSAAIAPIETGGKPKEGK